MSSLRQVVARSGVRISHARPQPPIWNAAQRIDLLHTKPTRQAQAAHAQVVRELEFHPLPAKEHAPAPRNPLGVQLLSPQLSSQVFPSTSQPTPPLHPHAISLSHAHLSSHGLSSSQGSVLTPTRFTLPPLQGKDLGEHFWTIGREAAQPWLSFSETFAAVEIPPAPTGLAEQPMATEIDEQGQPSPAHWIAMDAHLRGLMEPRQATFLRRSGWVKHRLLRSADGKDTILAEGEAVPYPDPEDEALVFDVETMVTASQFSVMATAASSSAWYVWISPWLLGETDRMDHLIPFGPQDGSEMPPRLLIGHNVGYDRARILDEYSLAQSNIRFLDTLSLHVATRGISSPQRPVWLQYRKNRAQRAAEKLLRAQETAEEQREELARLLGGEHLEDVELEHLSSMGVDLDALIDQEPPSPMPVAETSDDGDGNGRAALQWQDISSTNSLADVAALHCGIKLPKELRNIFVEAQDRSEILDQLEELLSYCARDVSVTHAVFSKVLPAFRAACAHPATFAGVLGLGSPILPVDDEWVEYQQRCNSAYEAALVGVRSALIELAEALRQRFESQGAESDWWSSDPWYSQMDWTPKKPKKVKTADDEMVPRWYRDYALGSKVPSAAQGTSVQLLALTLDGLPIVKEDGKWKAGEEVLSSSPTSRAFLTSTRGELVQSALGAEGNDIVDDIRNKIGKQVIADKLRSLADRAVQEHSPPEGSSPTSWSLLDWAEVDKPCPADEEDPTVWPRWYWDLFNPKTGELDLTIRTKVAPLLLKISWRGCPLFHTREHGWVYGVQGAVDMTSRSKPLVFKHEADEAMLNRQLLFHKVPHSAGEEANVGSPFGKSFVSYFEDGTLQSEHPDEIGKQAARDALKLNAQCSYWVGVRDRVANQMVVWDGEGSGGQPNKMGFTEGASGMRVEDASRRKGLILPPIITMGTITRRAIEKTWLTASNAKKNRVGSELKAMVKAPPGWSIVGADVDSEELWICSVMGDAQFGLHGATAVGWMTLEGTKSAGTDLHSKTASILGTSRNQAKIFNYSRIYGAGIRHATQLLLKANPAMAKEEATRKAKELYASTKGTNTHSKDSFGRKFWFGGTESFVFNKLEDVATSEAPRTPALDCGITAALSRQFLPKGDRPAKGGFGAPSNEDFMPSRINWVVQSSGVDYLHLLVTSMTHLCRKYDIAARFMLSVHDEVRYLCKDEDVNRTALALQIANLWTRAMFAFKLQMEDLPEGVAWFAAVDVDKVLRKEVDDPCITPSQPQAIPQGTALEIGDVLERTNGGSLLRDGRLNDSIKGGTSAYEYPPYAPTTQTHRALGQRGLLFLQAQATQDIHEIRALERRATQSDRQRPPKKRSEGGERKEKAAT